jgi:hypothetical protein
MTVNHYTILGLPSNGIDLNGERITLSQVRKAYRTKSLIYHPDKNPNAQEEAAARFRETQEAYEILSDENKRALFDESLAETTDQEGEPHLFVKLDVSVLGSVQSSFESDSDPQALVTHSDKGIDITELLEEALLNRNKIFEFATNNIALGVAMLNNKSITDILSTGDRFVLLFHVCSKLGDNQEQTLAKEAISALLESPMTLQFLTSIDKDNSIRGSFIVECLQNISLSRKFLSYKPEIYTMLTSKDILHLSKHIFSAVEILFSQLSYSINEKAILSFIQNFPEKENEIINLTQHHLSPQLNRRFAAAQAIMQAYKNNRDEIKKQDVLLLGFTVFDLEDLLPKEMQAEFNLFVFKFIYPQESFLRDASIAPWQRQKVLTRNIQNILKKMQDSCSPGQSIETQPDFHQNLITYIDKMDTNDCLRYFDTLELHLYNEHNRKKIINQLLTAVDNTNKLLNILFFEIERYYLQKALRKNRQLTIEFLNQDAVLNLDDIKLAKFYMELELEIDRAELKEPIAKKLGAQFEIMELLERIKNDENVSQEDILQYLKLFGFSSELLNIKTKDSKLILFILAMALEKSLHLLKYTNFTKMLSTLFLDKTIEDESILNLFEPTAHNNSLLNVLSITLDLICGYYDWSLLNLAVNSDNTREKLSAGLIYKFFELTQKSGYLNSIVGSIDDSIDRTIYIANFSSIMDYDCSARKATFEKIVVKAKEFHQYIKPRSYLASYIALSTNTFYLQKIKEYQELENLLESAQNKITTDKEDYELITCLLVKTKVDEAILNLLAERLSLHSQLYSAILIFIKLNNKLIQLPSLLESINASLSELKPNVIDVVTQYPTLAKTYLHINKLDLTGDELSLMEERCGLEIAEELDDAEIITRLISAKKMTAIMRSATKDSSSFQDELIDKKKLLKVFYDRLFSQLHSMDAAKLLDSKQAAFFILEMKKVLSQIEDNELNKILKIFLRIKPPQIFASVVSCVSEGSVLLVDFVEDWLQSPAMVQAFTQLDNNAEIISEYLKKPASLPILIQSLENNVDNPLTDYYFRMINIGKIIITDILSLPGKLPYKLLSFYFKKSGAAFAWPTMDDCDNHIVPQLVLASRFSLPQAVSIHPDDVKWLEQSNLSVDLLSNNLIQNILQDLQKYIAAATPQTLTDSDLASALFGLKQIQKFFPHPAIEELIAISPAAHQLTLFAWVCEVAFSRNPLFNLIIQQWLLNPDMLDLFSSPDLISGDLLMIVADSGRRNNLLIAAMSLTQLCPLGAYIINLCEDYSSEQLKNILGYSDEMLRLFYSFYLNRKKAAFIWPNDKAAEDVSIVCQLVLSKQLNLNSLSNITQETISYFNMPAIRAYLIENLARQDLSLAWLLQANENNFMFYPAINEQMLADDFLLLYSVGSLEYQICSVIAERYDNNTAAKFSHALAFFNDDFYKGLQNNIFTRITAQIELLENDKESFLKSDSKIKICQLQVVRNEMENLIIDHVVSTVNDRSTLLLLVSVPSSFAGFNQNLKKQLLDHIKSSAAKKEINEHRNLIGSFLKGLVGVLLGISTLGLIYLAKPCRQYFFGTQTAAKMNNWADELGRMPVQRPLS